MDDSRRIVAQHVLEDGAGYRWALVRADGAVALGQVRYQDAPRTARAAAQAAAQGRTVHGPVDFGDGPAAVLDAA